MSRFMVVAIFLVCGLASGELYNIQQAQMNVQHIKIRANVYSSLKSAETGDLP